ncbi:MAG: hypothetical protein ACLQPH_20290 [Acidimicrobiales bacterium]
MNLDDLFAQTEERPIPGGCDRCAAFQTVEVQAPGVYVMNVHHDDWCPFLRSRSARTN